MANRQAANELVTQARAAWYPSVDASAGVGRENSDNITTRALGGDVTLNRRETEVALTQLLFDGGASTGQVRRFSARAESSHSELRSAAEALAIRVAQAYLDLLRLRGQAALAGENVQAHERTVKQVEMLAEGGVGRRSDVQQAAGRLALANASLTQIRGQLALAGTDFRYLVGQDIGELREPVSLQQPLPPTLDQAIGEAVQSNPAIQAAEQELAAARADRESSRARLSPRLNLEVGMTHNNDIDGARGVNADRFAMLRLRYNLFRGGADEARIREAEARVDEALARVGKARNDVEREVRQGWAALQANRMRLPQLAAHARTSVEVVDAYRAQFKLGQRSLLDVLNAENEQFSARASLVSGAYAVAGDELRVLAGMGRLLESLGIALPDPVVPPQP